MFGDIRDERKPNYNEVRTETGKSWLGWLDVLDTWDEGRKDVHGTMIYLREQHKLHPLWAKAIAEYYTYVA
jgi:hypothetical protein